MLGDRLRTAREAAVDARGRKMSQAELARRSGVSQSMISQIETGERRTPGDAVLRKLERALGLPQAYLSDPASDPQIIRRSLERFRASDYGRDRSIEQRDLDELASFSWTTPGDDPPPLAWAHLFDAIRANKAAHEKKS